MTFFAPSSSLCRISPFSLVGFGVRSFQISSVHLTFFNSMSVEPSRLTICWIFQAYLNGLSIKTIADTLTAQGVPTRSGQEQWKANTITYVLTNEKYIGDTLFQKYYGEMTVPFKKHRNYGEMDQYYAKDTHEPIVEKTIFYAVQSLLKNRQATFKQEKRKNRYPLTSCIRCSECGSFYHRKVRNGIIKWVCSKHAADTTACNSSYYSEERIYVLS